MAIKHVCDLAKPQPVRGADCDCTDVDQATLERRVGLHAAKPRPEPQPTMQEMVDFLHTLGFQRQS